MLHINRVTLLGHAGRDPDIRALPDGGRAAAFGLATTERWKRADGGTAERTEWHRVAVYGAAVEPVEAMVRKGVAVLVEGRLARREFRDAAGRDREIVEIVVAGPRGIVNVLSPRPPDGSEAAEYSGPNGAGEDAGGDPPAGEPEAGETEPPAAAPDPEGGR